MAAGRRYDVDEQMFREGMYRPFFRQALGFGRTINNETYQLPKLYPGPASRNLGISVVGRGNEIPFSCLATDLTPQFAMLGASSSVSHYAQNRYQAANDENRLLDEDHSAGWKSNVRIEAISLIQAQVGGDVTRDAIFFYVYGVLHSTDFRREFEINLKKEAIRVPMVKDRESFDAFAVAGQGLCDLHVGYEAVEPFDLVEEWSDDIDPNHPDFTPDRLRVGDKKMKYPKVMDTDPDSETCGKKVADKTRLIYNSYLTLSGIPIEAHDYVLGTRSGIDWIIDRYYVKTDKASGIVNDPNQWGLERGDPRYILDLIKRVVTVSLRTVEIVNSLPKLTFGESNDAWHTTKYASTSEAVGQEAGR